MIKRPVDLEEMSLSSWDMAHEYQKLTDLGQGLLIKLDLGSTLCFQNW